jgi:hypothetical protein
LIAIQDAHGNNRGWSKDETYSKILGWHIRSSFTRGRRRICPVSRMGR